MTKNMETCIQDFVERRISAEEFAKIYLIERRRYVNHRELQLATPNLQREFFDMIFTAVDRYESDPEIRGWQYWNEEELLDEVQEHMHWYKFNLRKSELDSNLQKNEFDQSILDVFKEYFSKKLSNKKFLHLYSLKFITLDRDKAYRNDNHGFTEAQYMVLKNLYRVIYNHREQQNGKDLTEEIEKSFELLNKQ
jgi:hypothetical protein